MHLQQEDGTLFHAFNSRLKRYPKGLADSMDIRAHEWPLPLLESQAKATVFELRCSG